MDTSSTRYRAPMKKAQLTLSFMVKDWRLSPKTGNKVNLSALSRLPRWRLWLKNLTANAGDLRDVHSISGLERSPGGGNGYTLQYSCLENPLDRAAWQATVHRVAESDMTEHPHTKKVIGDPHTAFEEGHILLGLKWCVPHQSFWPLK